MKIFSKRNLSFFSFFFIPIISMWNPHWFSLMGVQPYWPLFWLLPWTILNGSLNGVVVGLFLGIMMDSVNNDLYTQIPGLALSGFWFGQISKNANFSNKFHFGLVTSVASLFCCFLYFSQFILYDFPERGLLLMPTAIKIIFAEVFLTGLFAPIFCSWLFQLFKNNNSQILSKK